MAAIEAPAASSARIFPHLRRAEHGATLLMIKGKHLPALPGQLPLKNDIPTYAPSWGKLRTKRFPRLQVIKGGGVTWTDANNNYAVVL